MLFWLKREKRKKLQKNQKNFQKGVDKRLDLWYNNTRRKRGIKMGA
jgi:hypothetical protein